MAGCRWLAGDLMRASRVWGRGGGCEAERWALLGAERDGSALRSRTIGASSEEGAGVSGRSRMEGPGIASRIEEAEARSAPCASSRTGSTSTKCWRARSHQMKRGEQQKGCHMGGSIVRCLARFLLPRSRRARLRWCPPREFVAAGTPKEEPVQVVFTQQPIVLRNSLSPIITGAGRVLASHVGAYTDADGSVEMRTSSYAKTHETPKG